MRKPASTVGVLGRLALAVLVAVFCLSGCEWLRQLLCPEDDGGPDEAASAWSRTYGHGDTYTEYHAYGLEATDDGGYVCSAQSVYNGAGGYDFWIVRLDAEGVPVWERGFGGENEEEPFAVRQLSDGGFIVVGESWSFRTGTSYCDAWVIRLTAAGAVVWQRTYGGTGTDAFSDVRETFDAGGTSTGFMLCGHTTSFGSGGYDVWLVEVDTSGAVTYEAVIGGGGNDFGRAAEPTSDGGSLVLADTQSFGAGGRDVWLVKLDENHDVEWETVYGGSGADFPWAVVPADGGGYVVGAYTDSFGAGGYDYWALKVDAAGDLVWQYTYGGTEGDLAHDLRKTPDGGYVMTGWTYSFGADSNDAWIVKIGAAGLVEWQTRYNITYTDGYTRSGSDWAYRIVPVAGGGYAISGDSDDVALRNGDVWVFKVSSTGVLGCSMAATTDAVEDGDAVVTVTDTSVGAMTTTAATVNTTTASGYNVSPEVLTQCEVE